MFDEIRRRDQKFDMYICATLSYRSLSILFQARVKDLALEPSMYHGELAEPAGGDTIGRAGHIGSGLRIGLHA